MKLRFKKLLSIVLVLCLFCSVTIVAFAEENTENARENALEIKSELAEQFIGVSILDENKIYSWNYAEENNAVEEEISTGIAPRWSSGNVENGTYGVHGEIIDEVNQLADNPIPSAYVTFVKNMCRKCDKNYSKASETYCPAFHASNNYVATLKYLWDFINEISSVSNVDVDVINSVGNGCYNNLPVNIQNIEAIQLLNQYTKKMVRNNFEVPSGVTNQTEEGRALYVLYGIMYHFLGDLYAHRVLVPKKAVDPFVNNFDSTSELFKPNKMFDPADFVPGERNTVKELVLAQELQFNHVNDYYVDNPSRNYADSPTFYPDRVEEASLALLNFVDFVDHGFYEWLIEPYYGFTLNNYRTYMEAMGYEWIE